MFDATTSATGMCGMEMRNGVHAGGPCRQSRWNCRTGLEPSVGRASENGDKGTVFVNSESSKAEAQKSSGDSDPKTSTLELTISGRIPAHQIRMILNEGVVTRIGRTPPNGIYWDLAISREHADLCWVGGVLRATCLAAARNPIVYRNETTREAILLPGELFTIGQTTFQVGVAADPVAPCGEGQVRL